MHCMHARDCARAMRTANIYRIRVEATHRIKVSSGLSVVEETRTLREQNLKTNDTMQIAFFGNLGLAYSNPSQWTIEYFIP